VICQAELEMQSVAGPGPALPGTAMPIAELRSFAGQAHGLRSRASLVLRKAASLLQVPYVS